MFQLYIKFNYLESFRTLYKFTIELLRIIQNRLNFTQIYLKSFRTVLILYRITCIVSELSYFEELLKKF